MKVSNVGTSESYAGGIVDNRVAISVWRGTPTLKDFERQQLAITNVVQQHPGKCLFLCCIEPSSPKPPPEAQDKITAMFKQFGRNLGAVAYVVEGAALRSAFVRSVMTGITMVKGTAQPMKFFPDIASAESWLRSEVEFPLDIDLNKAVEEVRKTFP